jgi:hypothetical protein
MPPCPKCGTPMDFIGKVNQWFCPNCKIYNPSFDLQQPYQSQTPAKTRKTMIIIIVIIAIILISTLIGFIILNDYFEPTFKIKTADLEPDNGEFKFSYSFSYDNFPGNEEEINWVIKLIGNGTVYGVLRMNMTIAGTEGSGGVGIEYIDVEEIEYLDDGLQTLGLDKYRVEVYWNGKLMDSVEKSF